MTRLRNLDTRIAELEAAKKSEVVHVRWDRSLRDHKESLDSYHPDGWVWDRVYPELHTPWRPDLPPWEPWPGLIRITMVPAGNHLPTEIPFEPSDLDAVSGVLRAPLVAEQPCWQCGHPLNFEAGRIRRLPNYPGRVFAGQSTVLAARLLESHVTTGVDVGVAPATADVQVVMGQPNSIIVQDAGDSVWLRPVGTDHAGLRLGTSLTRGSPAGSGAAARPAFSPRTSSARWPRRAPG